MRTTLLCITLCFLLPFYSVGQEGLDIEKPSDLLSMDPIQQQLDSSVLGYFVANAQYLQNPAEAPNYDSVLVPELSDSAIVENLRSIESFIPLDVNSKTLAFIKMYTVRKRELVPYILSLSQYYFPIFEAELDKQGLPLELKYLPVIESALKPNAVSRAGATGLWQFMYATAKFNGLEISSYVDQRRDPIASTQAGCKYLKSLYGMFGDWQLAIAAYNCGPGNVRKAIRRSGGKTNFWEIYNYLPRETRGYLPAFIAAIYFFHHYEAHNISVATLDLPMVIDTVMVDEKLRFDDMAKSMDISIDLLRALNPQYRVDVIPAKPGKPYWVILPMNKCLGFCEVADTLYKLSAVESKRSTAPVSHSTQAKSSGKAAVYYTVKSGDNLGYIADWFDTYVSYIKSWNGIYGSQIRVGKRLTLYVSPSKVSYYSAIDKMTFKEKKNISSHSKFSATSSSVPSSENVSDGNNSSYFYHTFRSGDSLWELSRKYPGNPVNQIKSVNNITDVRNIKIGQKIKLKKG